MKSFIAPAYTFTTGASGVGTVDLSGISGFNVKYLVSIINQTRGKIIYATGVEDFRYTNVTGTVVTLFADTSTMSNTDVLQVIYEDQSPQSVTVTNSLTVAPVYRSPIHRVIHNSAVTPIPASTSLPEQIVASTTALVTEIHWSDEIGEIIGLYSGASGLETLVGVFSFGGSNPLPVNLPLGTRISIRNMKNSAITSGYATIQLVG